MNTDKSTTTTLPKQSNSSLSPNTITTDPINTNTNSDSTTTGTITSEHRHRPTTTFQRSSQPVLGLRSRTHTQHSDAATTDTNVETIKAMAISTTITPIVVNVEDMHNECNDDNNKYAEAQKLLHHDYHSTDNNKSNNMSSCTPSRGHRRQKWLPSLTHALTARTMVTLVLLELLAVLSLTLAVRSVLPYHPYLLPLAIVLPILFSWSLYQTLSTRPRTQYNRTLRSYTHANSMIPHSKFPRCTKCCPKESIKLPRTHHCRKCGACTPRMSHHCGVLGVCIGVHNHKSFLLMLIYALVGTALLAATLAGPALSTIGVLFSPESGSGRAGTTTSRLVMGTTVRFTLRTVGWLYAVYLQFILTVGLSALLVFHIRLAALNWTVLELTVAKRMWPVLCCCVSGKWTRSGCSGRCTLASGVQHQQPQQSRKEDRAADGASAGGVTARHKSPFDTGSARENLAEIFATRSSHFVHLLMPVVDYDYAVRIAVARFEEELQRTDDQV